MIVYFSGTGNCKYVTERISAALNDTAFSIEKQEPNISIRQNECFGIVTPTYWWELPPIMREWLNELTLFGAGYTFLVATYGTTPGCCGEDARRILAKKNIRLDASFSVKMPDTWTPIFDLSDPDKVAKQNDEAEKYIDAVIQKVLSREKGNQTEHRMPYAVRLFTDPLLNSERKTKKFHVEDTCIGCGLCARKCPVQAIEIKDKKPIWIKEQCTLCLRCLHHCPKFAIQYGNGKTKQHGQYRNSHVKV